MIHVVKLFSVCQMGAFLPDIVKVEWWYSCITTNRMLQDFKYTYVDRMLLGI